MTATEKMTSEQTSELPRKWEKNTKQLLSFFFPLLFPRRESHVISLILVCGWQRGLQLCSSPRSLGSVPPAARLTIVPLPGGKRWQRRGREGAGRGLLHQGETLPMGSRQFQAIAPCSLGVCLHTHTHTHKCTHINTHPCRGRWLLMSTIMGCWGFFMVGADL